MRTLVALIVLLAVALAGLAGPGPRAASSLAPPAYRVIVHPSNPVVAVDRKVVADLFLRKATRWNDGRPAAPVDLPPTSAARRRFSDEVLRRSVTATRSYWQQIIFSGRGVPPPELDGDAAVIAFVRGRPGAIGYVSAAARIEAVKVVPVR